MVFTASLPENQYGMGKAGAFFMNGENHCPKSILLMGTIVPIVP
jgi:hypothetical protein